MIFELRADGLHLRSQGGQLLCPQNVSGEGRCEPPDPAGPGSHSSSPTAHKADGQGPKALKAQGQEPTKGLCAHTGHFSVPSPQAQQQGCANACQELPGCTPLAPSGAGCAQHSHTQLLLLVAGDSSKQQKLMKQDVLSLAACRNPSGQSTISITPMQSRGP